MREKTDIEVQAQNKIATAVHFTRAAFSPPHFIFDRWKDIVAEEIPRKKLGVKSYHDMYVRPTKSVPEYLVLSKFKRWFCL